MIDERTKAVLVELNDKEFDVLSDLSEQLNLSKSKVLLMALRHLQLARETMLAKLIASNQ